MPTNSKKSKLVAAVTPRPSIRSLWVYPIDPSLAYELDTVAIHRVAAKVRWETADLEPGPVGEYLEVIDVDPASNLIYPPVDLNKRSILANGGLSPSEGNPQFHQQMVYAVAMLTIQTFERALGRRSMWARQKDAPETEKFWAGYVKRLRIYPHALREQNAYYDPEKKALLFGYFPAVDDPTSTTMPGGTVFTCLSFDIVAHETTHALLDGLHPHFTESTNLDVFAFHEAFADIVALFQHFGMKEVLAHQIAKTRGDLMSQNLLGELAQQFGRATGQHGALRDALGGIDEATGQWKRAQPTGRELEAALEPHARGAVLVAAVFDAFVSIYKRRTADLIRLASNGTGILREGALHPDLVNRLAGEAAKSASHVLRICVRALDYCPPVDISFGDYLQALITADCDLVPEDDLAYRIAFIEAFRKRGIYPRTVRTLSEESLRWKGPNLKMPKLDEAAVNEFLDAHRMVEKRGTINIAMNRLCAQIVKDLKKDLGGDLELAQLFGVNPEWDYLIDNPRPCTRLGPDGEILRELTFDVLQSVLLPYEPAGGEPKPLNPFEPEKVPDGWFVFRGGSTVILDLESGDIRYSIAKNVMSEARRTRQREFLSDQGSSLHALYFGEGMRQPFAMLHRMGGLL